MEYALIFAQPVSQFEAMADPEKGPAALEPWKVFLAELAEAGIVRGGSRLAPPWTATTVRIRNGERSFQDGPFAETKEIASGFIIIDVSSLDEALKWAEKSPSSLTGCTEVRPQIPGPQ
jgi:hypothetical protein